MSDVVVFVLLLGLPVWIWYVRHRSKLNKLDSQEKRRLINHVRTVQEHQNEDFL